MTDLPGSHPAAALARDLRYWFTAGLPPEVEREAVRCMLNAAAAGIGGSKDGATGALVAAMTESHGIGDGPIIGREERLPRHVSAVVNAFAITQNDFDDAHFAAFVHPGAAALAGLLAIGTPDTPGGAAVRAFALGCEAQIMLALALTSSHYSQGWHTTATCAAIGSAVTVGLILGVDQGELAEMIDLAAIRVIGLRQSHGTEAKGYQVGRGAANGVAAAFAVGDGSAGAVPVVLGVHDRFSAATLDHELGPFEVANPSWHVLDIGYKPYPAGMVCFGAIEAALSATGEVNADDIQSIRLEVAPLAIELAGTRRPTSDSQARVSLPHAVAAALVERRSGLSQFSGRAIEDPKISRVREMVELIPRSDLPDRAAILEIRTHRESSTWSVDEPLGGPARPLTDADLEMKVSELIEGVDRASAAQVVAAVRGLPEASGLDAFLGAIRSHHKGGRL